MHSQCPLPSLSLPIHMKKGVPDFFRGPRKSMNHRDTWELEAFKLWICGYLNSDFLASGNASRHRQCVNERFPWIVVVPRQKGLRKIVHTCTISLPLSRFWLTGEISVIRCVCVCYHWLQHASQILKMSCSQGEKLTWFGTGKIHWRKGVMHQKCVSTLEKRQGTGIAPRSGK